MGTFYLTQKEQSVFYEPDFTCLSDFVTENMTENTSWVNNINLDYSSYLDFDSLAFAFRPDCTCNLSDLDSF